MKDQMRHLKVVYLSEGFILDMLEGLHRCDVACLPVLPEIPEGTAVLSVHHDWQHRAFGVVLEHESFPEVWPGTQIDPLCEGPMLDEQMVWYNLEGARRMAEEAIRQTKPTPGKAILLLSEGREEPVDPALGSYYTPKPIVELVSAEQINPGDFVVMDEEGKAHPLKKESWRDRPPLT